MTNEGRILVGGSPATVDDGGAPVTAASIAADVTLNPHKGLWTFDEVLRMLRDCGLTVTLSAAVGAAGWRARS